MGVGKREIEESYSYDELVLMMDMYAYANADEKEKKRYAKWPAQYKAKKGIAMTREEAKGASMFG